MSHCHTTADITADTEPSDCSEASAAVHLSSVTIHDP